MACIWRHLGGVYIDYSIIGFNRLFYQTKTKRTKQFIEIILDDTKGIYKND